jgi:excisionase family DNA binding protein
MSVQLPSHAVHADSSLSVQEAADALGCSEKTIRRRIKAGSINAHRLPTSQGYEWRVQLDGAVDQAPPSPAVQVNGQNGHLPGDADQVDTHTPGQIDSPAASEHEPSNEALLKALDFAERLQRENMELAGRVGFLQAKLQTAEEQILALSSGTPEPESAVEHEMRVAPASAEVSSPWQKLLGWLHI